MSRSADPGHFFQTSSALSESARKAEKSKNTAGDPIKLSSKLLAVAADPLDDGAVYVAEAAGNVRRIALETHEITHTFTGPTAPLTSLAVSPKSSLLFAGCWDKTIWAWPLGGSASSSTRGTARFAHGHADFVKAVLAFSLGGRDLLVSGGADAAVCVWDAASGALLHKLAGHARGVLALALDPAGHTTRLARAAPAASVVSAGSDREIRAWRITAGRAWQIPVGGAGAEEEGEEAAAVVEPLIAHETGVDALWFDAGDDLWTASADREAKCLARAGGWKADTALKHPDFVRDVVVDDVGGWVVTACRDEGVRVWEKGSGKLFHTFDGHFEEVTGLALLQGQVLVSVSIDATVRRWSLKGPELKRAKEEAERLKEGKVEEDTEGKKELLTEEEERELAELMEEDD